MNNVCLILKVLVMFCPEEGLLSSKTERWCCFYSYVWIKFYYLFGDHVEVAIK